MEVTEVRVKLINSPEDRLRGFCSVTFDHSFVVRDLKIIEGNSGPFVAMPSRKLTDNCNNCRMKNHLRANFCNQCGKKLNCNRVEHDSGGRAKLYADVAHPVNAACRELIQSRVVEEFKKELELSAQPGYSPRYDNDYFDEDHGPEAGSKDAPSGSGLAGEPAVEPPAKPALEALKGSEVPSPEDNSAQVRIDSAEKKPYKTHKPNDDLSQGTKSAEEDFGKGVFE